MTLVDRMKGCIAKPEIRNAQYNLTPSKEETLIRYILDLDTQGFPPWIYSVEDIANSLLATRCVKPVSKQWAYCFVQYCPKLKTHLLHAYDF